VELHIVLIVLSAVFPSTDMFKLFKDYKDPKLFITLHLVSAL